MCFPCCFSLLVFLYSMYCIFCSFCFSNVGHCFHFVGNFEAHSLRSAEYFDVICCNFFFSIFIHTQDFKYRYKAFLWWAIGIASFFLVFFYTRTHTHTHTNTPHIYKYYEKNEMSKLMLFFVICWKVHIVWNDPYTENVQRHESLGCEIDWQNQNNERTNERSQVVLSSYHHQ